MDLPSISNTDLHEFGIKYRGAKVRVQTDTKRLSDILTSQFLSYGAEITDPFDTTPTVSVLRATALSAARGWEHIRIHGGGDALIPGGATLLTGPPFSFTSVARPDISVLMCSELPHIPFIHHMVKYPLRDSIESKGGVLAHSASVEIMPGSCALFLGRSGAGKTTVFLEMVTQGLGGLGNDSTLLEPHGETVYAAAWPHIVRIGEGTVRHNSVLDSLASSDWAPRSRKDGKYELFFDTLEEIFERRIVGGPGPVTLVIDLTIDVTGTGFDSVRMTDADGRKFIEQLLVTDRLPTGWLPGWYWQPDIGAVRTVAELLLARVPMYRLNIGVADPRWPHRLSEWLRKKC